MLAPLIVFLLSLSIIAFGGAGAGPTTEPDGPERGFYLDRPAGAILGALGMVLFGGVTAQEAIHQAVNYDTLILLFSMMVLCAYMVEARLFRTISWLTVTHVRSARMLLIAVTLVAGFLSAVLVNDTVCLMITPLVVQCCRDARLRPLPFLLAVCFGANAGSVATPTGNPQNMIIGTLSGIPYTRFVLALGLPALVSLAVVVGLLLLFFHRDLPPGPLQAARSLDRPRFEPHLATLCGVSLSLVLVGFCLGYSMAWTSFVGAALLMTLGRRTPRRLLERVDYVLLAFFAGLFVVTYGVGKAGLAEAMFHRLSPWLGDRTSPHGPFQQAAVFGGFTLVASQLVSNVPFVLLAAHFIPHLKDPHLMWLSTALVSTLAGNLTIVGSVANIIVLDSARRTFSEGDAGYKDANISFWAFLRYGAVVTAASTVLAFLTLYAERRLGWM